MYKVWWPFLFWIVLFRFLFFHGYGRVIEENTVETRYKEIWYNKIPDITNKFSLSQGSRYTVEPRYNEVLGTMKITLLYQVSHYIRVKTQRNIKNWDQQNYLVIRGFCYISDLFITRFHCSNNITDITNKISWSKGSKLYKVSTVPWVELIVFRFNLLVLTPSFW